MACLGGTDRDLYGQYVRNKMFWMDFWDWVFALFVVSCVSGVGYLVYDLARRL